MFEVDIQMNNKKVKKKKRMQSHLKKLEQEKTQAEILKNFNVNLKDKMHKRSVKDKIILVLGHPLCIIVNITICFAIINGSLNSKFSMEGCFENTFENKDEICQPCLPELKDPFCLTCYSDTECTSCQYGHVLKNNLPTLNTNTSNTDLNTSNPDINTSTDDSLEFE